MRIALAQLDYMIGDFEGNLSKMKNYIQKARSMKADLVCFGELATCGYPPRDFLEFSDFISKCNQSIESLIHESKDIAIIVGSPTINPVLEGKDLFNSAYFLADGKVLGVAHKALLPTYDIFDEYRYFEPANNFECIDFRGYKIALTICEDIWNVGNENPLYAVCPMDELIKQGPDFMINVSASPFSYKQAKERISIVQTNVARYKVPMMYINHVGAQTDVIFDGGSLVVSSDGMVFDEMKYFEEDISVYELDDIMIGGIQREQSKDKIALIYEALKLGIKDYFRKLNFKTAILGLSGGIDSALTAVLATHALGKENVRVLLMPSQYSSSHSLEDAILLAQKLGIRFDIVPIKDVYSAYETILQPLFIGKEANITEENIQARIRGMLLMAISNKYGNILLNTSNKSEMAVGYGTLYGDMCGGIAVLGDVYKMEVYALANYINRMEEIIPHNSIYKPPSAELRPDQKDSDSLPPYEDLDRVLFEYIENRKGPEEIVALGFDAALVARILRMVNMNEFKREQTAPVIRVSPKAFGMGRRMPIVGKYLA
ncbi:MAG: NAD+ synthase [Saprospiraceae bacterium]|nr:NAD+ synthase [Candidatus Brachybacter algidus]